MKKWRKVVVVTGMLAVAMLINTKSFAKTVIVTTDGLNVREKASKTSDVLEMISKDEEVPLLEELDEWYKVKYSGVTGYISKDYSKLLAQNLTQKMIIKAMKLIISQTTKLVNQKLQQQMHL